MEVLPAALALSSSATSGVASIFLKYSTRNVKPLLVNSLKALSGTLGLALIILLSNRQFTVTTSSFKLILFISVTGPVLSWLFFIMALEKGGVSIVHPIVNSYPLTAIIAGLLLGYPISILDLIGAITAIVGFKLLFSNDGKISAKPVILAATTSILWGINTSLFKLLLETEDPITVAFWRALLASIILLPIAAMKTRLPKKLRYLIHPLLAGQLSDVLTVVLWLSALQTGELASTAILGSLGPIFSSILSKTMLKEHVPLKRYIGIIVVITGVSLTLA